MSRTVFHHTIAILLLVGATDCVSSTAVDSGAPGARRAEWESFQINPGAASKVVSSDFRLGIAVSDSCTNRPGSMNYTSALEAGGGWSDWACDENCFDPDAARLDLDVQTYDDVAHLDIRVCLQGSDGRWNHTNVGVARCTDWASVPGGQHRTGPATDDNFFDPDSYRVKIEVRPWPGQATDHQVDYRFRLRAWDVGVHHEWSNWTGWASEGGGATSWAVDSNCFDPDAFELEMAVLATDLWSFCHSGHRCQHGFGDCDSNVDCSPGTNCVPDVGHQYGYSDNSIDVCVD